MHLFAKIHDRRLELLQVGVMFGEMFLQFCWAFTGGGTQVTGYHPKPTLVGLLAAHQELQTCQVLLLSAPLVTLQVASEVVRLDKSFPALDKGYVVETNNGQVFL